MRLATGRVVVSVTDWRLVAVAGLLGGRRRRGGRNMLGLLVRRGTILLLLGLVMDVDVVGDGVVRTGTRGAGRGTFEGEGTGLRVRGGRAGELEKDRRSVEGMSEWVGEGMRRQRGAGEGGKEGEGSTSLGVELAAQVIDHLRPAGP